MDLYIIAAILFITGAGLIAFGRSHFRTAEVTSPRELALLHASVAGFLQALAVVCFIGGLFILVMAVRS